MEINVQRFETIDSTNLEAARQAEQGAAEGTCVVAREQTRGRGRQQRVWLSPPNVGLYLSVILRPRLDTGAWPLLTLMAAVAVVDALREAGGVEADIKWPNDVLVRDKKICGILAETAAAGRAVVLGIGINLKPGAFPEDLRNIAISLEEATNKSWQATAAGGDLLLGVLLRNLDNRYAALEARGGARATLQAWAERSSYAHGKPVRVTCGGETVEGLTRGLNHDGALRLETRDGDLRLIHAGDVEQIRMKSEG